MKRPLITSALAAATVLGSVVMVHAQTQDAASQPQRGQQGGAETAGPRREAPFPPPDGAHVGRMQDVALFDLAGKLAAAEIYIGVKPDQLVAWRAYTEALLDLVSAGPMPLPHPRDKAAPPPLPSSPPVPDNEKAGPKPQLPGEALSALILKKSEKAEVLQETLAVLRSALTSSQIDKLVELDRNLMRRPPPPYGADEDRRPFDAPLSDEDQPKD